MHCLQADCCLASAGLLWYDRGMKTMRFLSLFCVALLCACGERKDTASHRHWDESAVPISRQCARCHRKEYEDWARSDHAWAARHPMPELDAEAFAGQTLSSHGMSLAMERNAQGGYQFRDMVSGKVYPVMQVIGRRPLVQFAVAGERGAWQVPSAAWDPAKKEWFDVFHDDARQQAEGNADRKPGEWGHWLGRGMTWNSQCAWCHMSGYHKNYTPETDSFASTALEPGVTCIACHKLSDVPQADGCMVAKEDRVLSRKQNHDVCASCHARREELDDNFKPGDDFDDHFRLELPRMPGIFLPNGAQREEDYVETGFRLAQMGATGVTCYDCHDAHTGNVLAPIEDNSLCLRCHGTHMVINGKEAPYISPNRNAGPCKPSQEGACGTPASKHPTVPAMTKGNLCVECHMPEDTYMGRDPRRDHSLMPPDPGVSESTGVELTCIRCHADKGIEWCKDRWVKHYRNNPWMDKHRSRIIAAGAAMRGEGKEADLLAAYAGEAIPAWRATILGLLAQMPRSENVLKLARRAAKDESPMVRAAAAELLGPEAASLLHDSSRSVRHAAGWQVFPRSLQDAAVAAELEATARLQADQPTGAMQLAMLASSRRDNRTAEAQYRRAIELDPASAVPRMDYAVYLARQQRPVEALQQMLACTAAHPEMAEAQYRLGLILAEVGQQTAAIRALQKALELDAGHTRAAEALRTLSPAKE